MLPKSRGENDNVNVQLFFAEVMGGIYSRKHEVEKGVEDRWRFK